VSIRKCPGDGENGRLSRMMPTSWSGFGFFR